MSDTSFAACPSLIGSKRLFNGWRKLAIKFNVLVQASEVRNRFYPSDVCVYKYIDIVKTHFNSNYK